MDIKSGRLYTLLNDDEIRALADTEHVDYEDKLDHIVSCDPGPYTYSTLGLVPPAPGTDQLHYRSTAKTVLLRFQQSERILPRSVIMDEVTKRAASLLRQEDDERKHLTRKELAQLKSEVVTEMLPNTVIKRKSFPVLIRGKRVFIGAASAKICEDVLNKLRYAFGSLSVVPFETQVSASETMRRLLRNTLEQDELSDLQFALGSRVKLDHAEGSQVAARNEDLLGEHVAALLDDDYYPIEMSVHLYNEGDMVASLVLTKQWAVKSFRPVIESEFDPKADYGDDEDADWRAALAQFDADVILKADLLFSLVDTIVDVAGEPERSEQERSQREMTDRMDKASNKAQADRTLDKEGQRVDEVLGSDTVEEISKERYDGLLAAQRADGGDPDDFDDL